jgi:hypothetical protein
VHGERRRGRSRARILYWFRTPPGVRVGRAALDPEAIRLIEQRNPELAFDWPRILKGEGGERQRPERQPRPRPAPRPEPMAGPAAVAPPAPAPQPSAIVDEAPEPFPAPEPVSEPVAPAPDTPAGRRLGAEGLARLRARYSEVLARIEEKAAEPGLQAELNARAERLNPDGWVTDDEVGAGLEQYEAVYESLRAVVGRRRARRNR